MKGLFCLAGCIFPLFGYTAEPEVTEPEKSVVHITAFVQQPLWDKPWQSETVQKFTGSGFVIDGKRIMTNAHVVSWTREILVKRYDDSRSYAARVKFIGHDCDLAVLEVEDLNFFDGLEPIAFGHLPAVRSTVYTYGYPAGGDQISYTRGVVSRIELQSYSHIGNRSFLAVQTDAAINPGNSGGPVIQDGKVVGVAFQGIFQLENTGFFIPPPIIDHFLKDISDGQYDGFPDAGMLTEALQSPSYRRFLQLPDDGIGVRVDQVLPIPTTEKLIQVDDILLQVKSYKIGSDGVVNWEGNRENAGVIFDQAQHGETLPLKIWRKGKVLDISLPVFVYRDDRAEGNQYDTLPRYYVYGGLVFVPLSLNYLYTFGRDWVRATWPELRYELFFRGYENPQERRKEPVVLASVLSHSVNADMRIRGPILIDKVNGIQIKCLEDVARAFETQNGPYHVIEFLSGKQIECFSLQETEQVNKEILKTHRIAKDRRL